MDVEHKPFNMQIQFDLDRMYQFMIKESTT